MRRWLQGRLCVLYPQGVYVCVCMYVYMYLCMHVCMYLCINVCFTPKFYPFLLYNAYAGKRAFPDCGPSHKSQQTSYRRQRCHEGSFHHNITILISNIMSRHLMLVYGWEARSLSKNPLLLLILLQILPLRLRIQCWILIARQNRKPARKISRWVVYWGTLSM